ncbi:MAG: SRPBCC domain-containing protein [Acidimicrobiia bacterium]|nr:SRPBCC domain-containing protein [Acidimicrobiia bacterium]
MTRDLEFEETYPFPPERVWRAITDSAAIADWLMPNDFQPVVGHRFRFVSKPMPGWDGIVHCEVLEVDPPRRLVYSWNSGNGSVNTTVRWTLEPVASGTQLRLEQTGFRGAKALMISYFMGSGWKGIIRKHILAAIGRVDAATGVYTSAGPLHDHCK